MDKFKEMCRDLLGEKKPTKEGPKLNSLNKDYDMPLDIVQAYKTLK